MWSVVWVPQSMELICEGRAYRTSVLCLQSVLPCERPVQANEQRLERLMHVIDFEWKRTLPAGAVRRARRLIGRQPVPMKAT